jgi:L-lactate dehydrogenase complex protein LldG
MMRRNHQNEFIQTVRAALGHPAFIRRKAPELFPHQPCLHAAISDQALNRSVSERRLLLEKFRQEAIPLNLDVIGVDSAHDAAETIVSIVRQKETEWGQTKHIVTWKHPLIDRLNLSDRLSGMDMPVHVAEIEIADRDEFCKQAQHAIIGVTSADYAIAESATLVLKTRPGQPRSVSLTPSIHIAVITLNHLIDSFRELYAILQSDPADVAEGLTSCMTFISGPSKTADIEACMVHGAHGPREVYVLVLLSPDQLTAQNSQKQENADGAVDVEKSGLNAAEIIRSNQAVFSNQ